MPAKALGCREHVQEWHSSGVTVVTVLPYNFEMRAVKISGKSAGKGLLGLVPFVTVESGGEISEGLTPGKGPKG